MKSIILLTCAILLLSMFGCGLDSRTNVNVTSENVRSIDGITTNDQLVGEIPTSMQPYDEVKNDEDNVDKQKGLPSSYWEDMLRDFDDPINAIGRDSLIENNSMIPHIVNDHVTRNSYAIGSCTELKYLTYEEKNLYLPLMWEIRYPQLYLRADADDVMPSETVKKINLLLYETMKKMISDRFGEAYIADTSSGEGYCTYDIAYATDDLISICFYGFGRMDSNGTYMFSAITIDLSRGRVLHLEDFLNISTLTTEKILAEYTVEHKNSFSASEITEPELERLAEGFLNNINASSGFFISDESKNEVFLVLKTGQYYFIFGK